MSIFKKIMYGLCAGLIALVYTISPVLEKVDTFGFSYIIANGFASYFSDSDVELVESFKEKTGGFMKGVCHPNYKFDEIKKLNAEWVRFDNRNPIINLDGSDSWYLDNLLSELKVYHDNGLKVLLITPYPSAFYEMGADPRTDEGKEFIRKNIRRLVEACGEYISAIQVTNEMGTERFLYPLTIDEAADFVGIQLEELQDIKGDIVAGFNVANKYLFIRRMEKYWQYCDYLGLDIYMGCFENILKDIWLFDGVVKGAHHMTGLPIVICEFGYQSYGQPKTKAEKTALLQSYGFNSEQEARDNIRDFVAAMPQDFQDHIRLVNIEDDKELAKYIFEGNFTDHVYRQLSAGYQLRNYDHTLDGQANFYTDVLERLSKLDCLAGTFIFQLEDNEKCYVCGNADCPVETGWGLLDGQGNPKPSYYAVQKAFAEMK